MEYAFLFFNNISIAPYIMTERTTEKIVLSHKDLKPISHNRQMTTIPTQPIIESSKFFNVSFLKITGLIISRHD